MHDNPPWLAIKSGNTSLAEHDNTASASLPIPGGMLKISAAGATSGFSDRGQRQKVARRS
jgi:hypothetical protein